MANHREVMDCLSVSFTMFLALAEKSVAVVPLRGRRSLFSKLLLSHFLGILEMV